MSDKYMYEGQDFAKYDTNENWKETRDIADMLCDLANIPSDNNIRDGAETAIRNIKFMAEGNNHKTWKILYNVLVRALEHNEG